jgi:hypothetical protein
LLAVQDVGQHEMRAFVRQADALPLVQLIGDRGVELDHHGAWHQGLLAEVERLVEIEIGGVGRIPEMIVRRGDDRIEGVGALAIAIDRDHGGEVVAIECVVDRIVGDVISHRLSSTGRLCVVELQSDGKPRATSRRIRSLHRTRARHP